jgi:hypothetical protein
LTGDCDALLMVSSHPWLDHNQGMTEKNDHPIFWYLFKNTNILNRNLFEWFIIYLTSSPYNSNHGIIPLNIPFIHIFIRKGYIKMCQNYATIHGSHDKNPLTNGMGYSLNGMESIVDSDSVPKYYVFKFMSKTRLIFENEPKFDINLSADSVNLYLIRYLYTFKNIDKSHKGIISIEPPIFGPHHYHPFISLYPLIIYSWLDFCLDLF